jgi:hypothetical protein
MRSIRLAGIQRASVACLALLAPHARGQASAPTARWPEWRGPHGTGTADGEAPLTWSNDANVRWRVELPGGDGSTPIVWDDLVFVTALAPATTPAGAPATTPTRTAAGGADDPRRDIEAVCLSRHDGTVLWRRTALGPPADAGAASVTACTDGARVYVSAGAGGAAAFDLAGAPIWTRDAEGAPGGGAPGAAPAIGGTALAGDLLIETRGGAGGWTIRAIDAATGAERWRRVGAEPGGWSAPLVIEWDGRSATLAAGAGRARLCDTRDGSPVWERPGLGPDGALVPLRLDDLVVVGHRDPRPALTALSLRSGAAAPQGAAGATTRPATTAPWTTTEHAPTCAAVLHEGRLHVLQESGALACLDARSGALLDAVALPGGNSFRAAPIAAGGRLYLPSEQGNVFVLGPGPPFEPLAMNRMGGESFAAAPAAAGGDLLLRSRGAVFCIGSGQAAALPEIFDPARMIEARDLTRLTPGTDEYDEAVVMNALRTMEPIDRDSYETRVRMAHDLGLSGPGAPQPGEPAPDFALLPLRFYDFQIDRAPITQENAGSLYEPVRLSAFRGSLPVVLIFGSYS